MLEQTLHNMLLDLNLHKGRDKSIILEKYIQARLNKSLRVYYDELMQSYNALLRRDELKIAKRLDRTIV